MINVLLFEDNASSWEDYQDMFTESFADELKLLNPNYTPDFKEMKEILREKINDVDLIIADIALSENIHDLNTWSSQMIQDELFGENGQNGDHPVRKRGIAIAFMTAHIKQEINTRMRNNTPQLFNKAYIYTDAIRKGEFEDDLHNVIQNFQALFVQPIPNGRWYKNDLLKNIRVQYLNNQYHFGHQGHPLTIQGNQIISLIHIEDTDWRILYINAKNQLINGRIAINRDELFDNLNVYNGADEHLPNVQETIAFLSIRNNPCIIINTRTPAWEWSTRENRAAGRIVKTKVDNQEITLISTFKVLYDFYESSENFVKFNGYLKGTGDLVFPNKI